MKYFSRAGFHRDIETALMDVLYLSNPVWHDVCAGCSVMQVENDHTQDDREGDQDHSEHDIVDDHRDAEWSLWDFVSQQQHEDSESDEDGNGEGHLFSCTQNEEDNKTENITL